MSHSTIPNPTFMEAMMPVIGFSVIDCPMAEPVSLLQVLHHYLVHSQEIKENHAPQD